MATILRSSRYIRGLSGLGRRIVISNDSAKFISKSLETQARTANAFFAKSYAIQPAAQRSFENSHNFGTLFRELDEKVQRYGKVFKHEVEAVLAKVHESGTVSSQDALFLIRCCGNLLFDMTNKDKNILIDDIWSTFDVLKIPLDVSHFNALLRVYLENNHEFSPVTFLNMMKQKNAEPNRVTYQRLILYYCKRGNIQGTTEILELMKEKDMSVDENIFNALITGHSEAGDLPSAENILEVMKTAGVPPCASTYTALLCAYAKFGDMEAIQKRLSEIVSKNLYLGSSDFFEVILSLVRNNHAELIDPILEAITVGPDYNFVAAQTILKIADYGNVDPALKILNTMKSNRRGEPNPENDSGAFLLRKMVNSKYPVEQIIATCQTLSEQGLNKRGFSIATQRAIFNGDQEASIALMKAWRENGGPIREHYFWPLLIACGKRDNYQGILDLLKVMISEFKTIPTYSTIKDYVYPYAIGQLHDIVRQLESFEIPHDAVCNGIANRILNDHEMRKTAAFMQTFPAEYDSSIFYQALAEATTSTGDSKSFAIIVRFLCESPVDDLSPVQIASDAVITLALHLPQTRHDVMAKVVKEMVDMGLSISPEAADEIRKYFSSNMSSSTDEELQTLTAGTLTPKPISELADSLESRETDKAKTRKFRYTSNNFARKRREFDEALTNNDYRRVEKLIQELETSDFLYNLPLQAQILEILCAHERMEAAESWVNKMKGITSEISPRKILHYAILLAKNKRFDDAIAFIKEAARSTEPGSSSPFVRVLLDLVAAAGDVAKTNEMFDALVNANLAAVDKLSLGSLVKVHLVNDNLSEALNVYARACTQYKCTPLKHQLAKVFIEKEDADSLQRLTDLSTPIHGENNSLIDLVMAFIEVGRLRQARKILETPGLKLTGKRLQVIVHHNVNEDRYDYLEQLADITSGLYVVNKQEFYDVLMSAYDKKDDWQRGLALWISSQDQNLQPSKFFLDTLARLLRRNNQEVPFFHEALNDDAKSADNQQSFGEFNRAIQNGDFKAAERICKRIEKGTPARAELMSVLISETILKNKNIDKACQLTEELLSHEGTRVNKRHKGVHLLWTSLLNNNDFERLLKFDSLLSETAKKAFNYAKYRAEATLKEHGLKKFLADFQAKLKNENLDAKDVARKELHYSSLLQALRKEPEVVEEFRKIAENCTEKRIFSPMNILWCYYVAENDPKANEIWAKYFDNPSYSILSFLMRESIKENDTEMLCRLHDTVRTSAQVPITTRVTVAANLIQLYRTNNDLEAAKKIVESMEPEALEIFKKDYSTIAKDYVRTLEKSEDFPVDDTRVINKNV